MTPAIAPWAGTGLPPVGGLPPLIPDTMPGATHQQRVDAVQAQDDATRAGLPGAGPYCFGAERQLCQAFGVGADTCGAVANFACLFVGLLIIGAVFTVAVFALAES